MIQDGVKEKVQSAPLKRHITPHRPRPRSRSRARARARRWNNWVPRKVGLLSWRVALNRLPVLTALARRNIVSPSVLCPICGEAPEVVAHIFLECGLAQSVWEMVSQWCKIQPMYSFSFKGLLEVHVYTRGSALFMKALHGIVLIAIWCIWRARNDMVFKGVKISLHKLVGEIKAKSFLWIRSRAKLQSASWYSWTSFDSGGIGL
uniref:uncharacterized protein LOC122591546 n=1 Tax=Erigeron canadensis TaxID=72917 RepID=UPI001CB920AD|nr:uncharacterized protein LOC122591546 [Erigeron canadensis]